MSNYSHHQFNNGTFSSFQDCQVSYTVSCPIISLGIAIVCIIILNTYLKNLHVIIKTILIALCLHNAISALITIIFFFVSWCQVKSYLLCSFMFINMKSVFLITAETVSLVSFVRYHMAQKTAKTKKFNMFLIIGSAVSIYIMEYILNILLVSLSQPPLLTACMTLPDKDVHDTIPVIIVLIKEIIIICFGIIFDLMMIKFLWRRNQVANAQGHSELDPWKVSNENDYDYAVPVHATLASLLGATLICLVCGLIFQFGPTFEHFVVTDYAFPSILMPILLALTIRAARSVQAQAPVPRQLHFHEDQPSDQQNQDLVLEPMAPDQDQPEQVQDQEGQQQVLDHGEAQIQCLPQQVQDELEGAVSVQRPSQAPKLAKIIEEVDSNPKDYNSN